jgi:hypothetical protein
MRLVERKEGSPYISQMNDERRFRLDDVAEGEAGGRMSQGLLWTPLPLSGERRAEILLSSYAPCQKMVAYEAMAWHGMGWRIG